MVEACVAPSELHLKKELTALRKARFLRDPETCSSWRSPLSSKSFAAANTLNYVNGTKWSISGGNHADESRKLTSSENRQKKVYLYNWRNHSSKASDNGIKLDKEDRNISVEGSLEDSSSTLHKTDSASDTYVKASGMVHKTRGRNPKTPVRKTAKKLRSVISKRQVLKHTAALKLLDLPSSSFTVVNSVEQSDDTEHSNTEDMQQSTHGLALKTVRHSPSVSPFFSGAGCGNWSYSSKILRSTRREGSSHSYTPASTSSYYRYGGRNPSIADSWDGTTASLDGDDLDQLDLPRHQGCGIPCYWPKRAKDRGCGGFCSPSLSDTLRRTGSSIFCGSHTLYNKKRSSASNKQKYLSKSSQGLPLLSNSCEGGDSSLDTASDELSINFGELEMEALSRLDGRRWSSCKSQEELEPLEHAEAGSDTPGHRNISQKYKPRSFDEIVGQNIVVHSLSNAILRGRIAPAYLFQGPRGTGKTTAARIFAAALNCLSTKENKPCGVCRECNVLLSGNGSSVREVDATNKKAIDRIRNVLKNVTAATAVTRYKVFIIDECHMLSSKIWSAFMNILEEPPSPLVFIFITIDSDNLPRAIMSRCQKYLFSKVQDIDIVRRLRKLSAEENLDAELDALELIALNSDGSLRDAETMLEQLSLLGRKITTSLVNDLVGVVSDDKLLDLLEIAMSSDTAETVRRSRELMSSGVDPVALMSQLAGLIMDIIAGTYQLANSQYNDTTLGGQSLSEDELQKLQQALKILSDAEKQLRLSSERSTWFTAALLRLGSGHNSELTQSSISSKHSTKKVNDVVLNMVKDTSSTLWEQRSALVSRATSGQSSPHSCLPTYRMPRNECLISDMVPANGQSVHKSSLDVNPMDGATGKKAYRCGSPKELIEIWRRCIKQCHSETLKQLLYSYGKLASITEVEGVLIAFVVFEDSNIKSRVERYLSSITNSFELVLKHNVEVRIGVMPENHIKGIRTVPDSPAMEAIIDCDNVKASDKDRSKGAPSLARLSVDSPKAMLQRTLEKRDSYLVKDKGFQLASSPKVSSDGNGESCVSRVKGQEISVRGPRTVATDEHMLESVWLQDEEQSTCELGSHSNPERNQVWPQNGISIENMSSVALVVSSKNWEDKLNHDIKALKVSDIQGLHNKQSGGWVDHYAISPSLLHRNGFTSDFDKKNLGYESGPGCSGLLCWQPRKPYRGKVKQGSHVRSQKTGRLNCLGNMRNRRHQ